MPTEEHESLEQYRSPEFAPSVEGGLPAVSELALPLTPQGPEDDSSMVTPQEEIEGIENSNLPEGVKEELEDFSRRRRNREKEKAEVYFVAETAREEQEAAIAKEKYAQAEATIWGRITYLLGPKASGTEGKIVELKKGDSPDSLIMESNSGEKIELSYQQAEQLRREIYSKLGSGEPAQGDEFKLDLELAPDKTPQFKKASHTVKRPINQNDKGLELVEERRYLGNPWRLAAENNARKAQGKDPLKAELSPDNMSISLYFSPRNSDEAMPLAA